MFSPQNCATMHYSIYIYRCLLIPIQLKICCCTNSQHSAYYLGRSLVFHIMFNSHRISLVLSLLLSIASADWKFKSRPDLSPPTLNTTVPASADVAPGYIFVAPYSWLSWDAPLAHGPLQPAPYIFASTGGLVWSGFGYFSGWGGNFQSAKYKGEDVLFAFEGSRNTKHGHSHGHAKILNKNYETIKEVRSGNHALLDLHEFEIVDGKTALVESYRPVPYDLTKYGAKPESQWIVDATFQGKCH